MAFLDRVKSFLGLGDKEEIKNPSEQLNNVGIPYQQDFGDLSLTSQELPQNISAPLVSSFDIPEAPVAAKTQASAFSAPEIEIFEAPKVSASSFSTNLPEVDKILGDIDRDKQSLKPSFELPTSLPATGVDESSFITTKEPTPEISSKDYRENTKEESKNRLKGAWNGISDRYTGSKNEPYRDALDQDGTLIGDTLNTGLFGLDGNNRQARNHRSIVEQTILDGGSFEDYQSTLSSQRESLEGETTLFGRDKFDKRYGNKSIDRAEYDEISAKVSSGVIERDKKRNETEKKESAAYDLLGYKDNSKDLVDKAYGVFLNEDTPSYERSERQSVINGFSEEMAKFNTYTKSAALNYQKLTTGGNATQGSIDNAKKSIDLMDTIVKSVGDKSVSLMEIGQKKGQSGISDFLRSELSNVKGVESLNLGELENLYLKQDFVDTDRTQYGLNSWFAKHKDISPEDLLGVLQSDVNQREARANLKDSDDLFETVGNLFGGASKGFAKAANAAYMIVERDITDNALLGLGDVLKNTPLGSLGYNQVSGAINSRRFGSSGDFEFTKLIRSSDEIKEKPKNRLMNAKRLFLRAQQGSPEFITLAAEMFAPVPKVGVFRGISRAEKLVNGMIDGGVAVDKAREAGAAFGHAQHMLNKGLDGALALTKEVVIEGTAGTLSERQGSEADDALMTLGIGLGAAIELFPRLKDLANLKYDKAGFKSFLNGNLSAKELGADGIDTLSAGTIRNLGKLKVKAANAFPDADVNTMLKSMLKDGVEHKAVMDDIADGFIRDGVILDTLLSKDGASRSLDDIDFNLLAKTDGVREVLSPERQGLLTELDVLVGDPKTTFNQMLQEVTGLPFGEAKSGIGAIQKTPTYKILRNVAENFPKDKPITVKTRYTQAEVDSIIKSSKGKGVDFGVKNEDGSLKYFEKDKGGFALKIEEMGEGIGITKLKFTDDELAKLSKSEEGFVKTMEAVNINSGNNVYDVGKVVKYGMYNTLNETLSKILC